MPNRKRFVAQFVANVFEKGKLKQIYVSFLIKAHDAEEAYSSLMSSKRDFNRWIQDSNDAISACVYIFPMPSDDLVMLTHEIPDNSIHYNIKGELDVRENRK